MDQVPKDPPSARARIIRRLRFMRNVRGWQRLANAVVPQDASLEFVTRNGAVTFSGNLESFIDRQIYLYGGYEEDLIVAFLELVPALRRNVILDVGANVGTHTLRFAQMFKSVVAFEPNPVVFEQLTRNITSNRAANVKAHQIGLADRDGLLDFHVTDAPNHGLGTFAKIEQYDRPLKLAGQARVTRGDSFLQSGDASIDAIKMDIQGFEVEAMKGLHDTLHRHQPFVWFEVSAATRERMGSTRALRDLLPYEFSLQRFERVRGWFWNSVRLVPVSAEAIEVGDYVAVPIGKTSEP